MLISFPQSLLDNDGSHVPIIVKKNENIIYLGLFPFLFGLTHVARLCYLRLVHVCVVQSREQRLRIWNNIHVT